MARRRRTLLVLAAASVAVAVWAAAPALSVKPYVPRVVEFGMPVPAVSRPAAVGAAGGSVTTPVLRAAKRFDLFGVTWHGPLGARVEVRVRLASGRWSPWHLGDHAVDVPDRSAAVHGTEPIWVGGADALQLRLPRSVHGVHVDFVNSTGTATTADRLRTRIFDAVHTAFVALVPGSAGADTTPADGRPRIIARSAWAGNQCKPRHAPGYGVVKLGFVHHTDNLNGYGPGQSAAIVLAICRFHRDTRGWDDIGYNFLVDRYGQIFEGAAGGVDRPVVGAQVKGFNTVSTGVANIGTFVSTSQTRAGMGALARVLAWKLTLHGVPATGRVRLVTTEPNLNGKPKGTVLHLNLISGHRDANATDCPGSALYAGLPSLRRQVAALAAPLTSLGLGAARNPVRSGQPVVLSGRLARAARTPVAGAQVAIQMLRGTTFATVGGVATGPDGLWSATLPLTRSATFRASYPGDASHRAAVSEPLPVRVRP
ncbi:MAG TPA: N-acetylmuramoyl-L-alanine amidase [Solirubrobacteraceae bacterium]|nr:N-acetylmuramoyl-L-alanine amidase [Solirubrobacteraceae bacterium]